ncbi:MULTISPECIES: potassium transporter Kup [unclassified Brevundimonas]|uniref:potassium transporter Kup n=1 Tax=unclassified Brevundimonas TaxID=2622653 RepID=UPI0007011911|nr:potassium transport protein Kup [Brevundimonas sp. Root1423]KRA29247.1 potassium transport protein Kup [Brevundimonas sp. Root608]
MGRDENGTASDSPEDVTPSGGMLGPHTVGKHSGFLALAIGSIGVVFGDIGTSPLYAMREALHRSDTGGGLELSVLGVVSLIFWALILVVTVKYVFFMMRADNKGEGGTLALMALAQRAMVKHSRIVFLLGACGAALFYGDGIVTPASSVMGALEGLKEAPGIGPQLAKFALPSAIVILIALFMVQSRGTAAMGRFFGPVTILWFLVIATLGLINIGSDLSIFRALSPHYGVWFLFNSGAIGFIILGSVFLAVTGAEALYADMGHFGRGPIRAAWFVLVFPCLMLNYLGQGALVLSDPTAAQNPFFRMIPELAYWPVVALAIAAAIIASQAVISGAFSLTQQAVQLGLLPRLRILRTSETQAGQIYVPAVNAALAIGVVILLVALRTSTNLNAAYGIAVTGAMLVDTLLFFVIIRFRWKRPLWQAIAAVSLFALLDIVFLTSNLLKIPNGAWIPLVLGAAVVLIMETWSRGVALLSQHSAKTAVPLTDTMAALSRRPCNRTKGTAIFLTSDPDKTPAALLHNLKHNGVLHERNVILNVHVAEVPRVAESDRIKVETLSKDFERLTVNYGFMEQPHIPRALALARRKGLKFDIMTTSFFLSRRTAVPSKNFGMPLWQDHLFVTMLRNAGNPTEFFQLPPARVIEMGAQVKI